MASTSSSSSSAYCQFPDCEGIGCLHFSSWSLSGVTDSFTDEGILYVLFNTFESIQQVEIYKDNNYLELVAIGQNTVSPISIYQRGGSGISGQVIWDGTLTGYASPATLYCVERSSSSSISSISGTSSSSSVSSESFSSSSSNCCTTPYCYGDASSHFTSWILTGLTDNNSTDCSLFVGLVTYGVLQQVRVYKDSSYVNLVAIGQRSSNGTLTLTAVNSSGLSGSLTYDGTLVPYPSTLLVTCEEQSSSSSTSIDSSSSSSILSTTSSSSLSVSTSSSSLDSSSSSSSSSVAYSSSSSKSYSSKSSQSFSSSSSSSSLDSSSSSSESIGNVSSSSSSSLVVWNQIKPLVLANTAIESGSLYNRLAQTIHLIDTTYTIGDVYCYLYEPTGTTTSYKIHLSIYSCNNDGTPLAVISTQTINASSITETTWYKFNFGISGATPANGYLSFIMWQDGGDEDNYVLWGYAINNVDSTAIAWVSHNNLTWEEQEDTLRALKVTQIFDPYDLTNYRIVSPPATSSTAIATIDSEYAEYVRTKEDSGNVVMDYPNALVSFIVDSSGSMGWNDRMNNRSDIVQKFVDKFINHYPSDVFFDIVKFGGRSVNAQSITSSTGQPATINLDLTDATRTPYFFTIDMASVSQGSVYISGTKTFTVLKPSTNVTTLVCHGTGDPLTTSGTLTFQSGLGPASIVYTSYTKISLATSKAIAYGFSNLEGGHTYNIGNINFDNDTITDTNVINWQLYNPSSEAPTISEETNGPSDSASLDISATTHLTARKMIYNGTVNTAKALFSVGVGINQVTVDNSNLFSVSDTIDLVDGKLADTARIISDINYTENIITFSPVADYPIQANNDNGAIIQDTNYDQAILFDMTTANLLVRDVNVTKDITFFVQTVEGVTLEWDFRPFTEWTILSIYWLDETAVLPFSVFDKDGHPFPDGTKIELYVDQKPDIYVRAEETSVYIEQDTPAWTNRIYLTDNSEFDAGDIIDITDNRGNIQTVEILDVGTDPDYGEYIDLVDPLLFNLSSEYQSNIKFNNANDEATVVGSPSTSLTVPLSLVDVTPIIQHHDTSNPLQPYDIARVSPLADYSELNTDPQYIQKEIKDMPTVDGYSVVRVLPITEDNIKTTYEKNKESNRLLRLTPSITPPSDLEFNDGDLTSTPSNVTGLVIGDDYSINTPVFLISGEASSSMNSYATEFTETEFDNITIPGIGSVDTLMAKLYNIYPVITVYDTTGDPIAYQYFKEFSIYFVPPIYMTATKDGQTVSFHCEKLEDDESGCSHFRGYEQALLPGVYASGNSFTITYTVTNKFVLQDGGSIHIRLYSNKVTDADYAAGIFNENSDSMRSQAVNLISTVNPSAIDTWRDAVKNNPANAILGDNSTNQNTTGFDSGNDGIINDLATRYANIVGGNLEQTSTPGMVFYTNPYQWTLATQYENYEFDIPIINGKATLTVPASDIISLLFVEASVSFGTDTTYEAIAMDYIFVANPVDIGGIEVGGTEDYACTPDGISKFEVGVDVLWRGVNKVIEDGTNVNFAFDSTKAAPLSSATNDGWAGGIFVGPRDTIIFPATSNQQDILCPPDGILESATIQVYHSSGYTRKVTRSLLWRGTQEVNATRESFYFKLSSPTQSIWADGLESSAVVTSDISDGSENWLDWRYVGEDGCLRLSGQEGDNGPQMVEGDSYTIPNKQSWVNSYVAFTSTLNQNIGNQQLVSLGEELGLPWVRNVYFSTSYVKENMNRIGGTGVENLIVTPEGTIEEIYPKFTYAEPLGITVNYDLEETPLVRDGVDSPVIVANVTWKGSPLNETIEYISTYGFPTVTFVSGICAKPNLDNGKLIDTRNTQNGCYIVAKHVNAKLTTYASQVGLFRTDINDIGGNKHTHACTVSSNGDGTTTSTIVISGAFGAHTHTISGYVAAVSADPVALHTHDLRSVALTQFSPTTDVVTDFVINGYVIFDPTNAEPYAGEGNKPGANRMMFSTLSMSGTASTSSQLTLTISTSPDFRTTGSFPVTTFTTSPDGTETQINYVPTYYTARTPSDTLRGFDIKLYAEWSAYDDGIYHPAVPVSDSSRITVNIQPYRPPDVSESDQDILVSAPGTSRSYLQIIVKGQISLNGQTATAEQIIKVDSISPWIPYVYGLFSEPTTDQIYISDAINQIESYGASQIHDAVYLASSRLIQYQTENPSKKGWTKLLVLLTDGDENSSEHSLSDAISSINWINGDKETQIIPIQLGQPYSSDAILLQKYVLGTNGFMASSMDYTDTKMDELIDSIVTNTNFTMNYGIYTDRIVFDMPDIPKEFSMPSITVPIGSSAQYSYRTSEDNITWSIWSEWIDYGDTTTFEQILANRQKYFEYSIKFFGSHIFVGPTLNGGVSLVYWKPQSSKIFFQPIYIDIEDDDYISSVHVTHHATIPDTSEVSYQFSQSSTVKPNEFVNVRTNTHELIATRYNEKMTTTDYKTYFAINGAWASGSNVQVFEIIGDNSLEIDTTLYAINPNNGSITFTSQKNPSHSFVVCIGFVPYFRLLCNIINYGEEVAIIDHVGIMYNIMQRIPRDSDGNIIHKNIGSRIS